MIEILESLRSLPGAQMRDRMDRWAASQPLFVVGGALRDLMLGARTTDLDLAGDSAPEAVAESLAGAAEAGHIDPDLGTWNWAFRREDGVEVELAYARFRTESDYGADRRPSRLDFVGSPEEDAARRDFTVNAIYLDWTDGALLDPTGGVSDLVDRRLRMIGPPEARLDEDPLRILRAVRFAGRLGLSPDEALAAAMRALAPRLGSLSGQRIHDECRGALIGPGSAGSFERLLELGAFAVVDPAWSDTLRTERQGITSGLAAFEGRSWGEVERSVFVWALLTQGLSADRRALVCTSLQMPRQIKARIEALSTLATYVAREEAVSDPDPVALVDGAIERALRQLDPESDSALLLALSGVQELPQALLGRWRALHSGEPPTIDGNDLIALGLPPGPAVGAMLRRVREALASGAIRSREDALAFVRRDLGSGGLQG